MASIDLARTIFGVASLPDLPGDDRTVLHFLFRRQFHLRSLTYLVIVGVLLSLVLLLWKLNGAPDGETGLLLVFVLAPIFLAIAAVVAASFPETNCDPDGRCWGSALDRFVYGLALLSLCTALLFISFKVDGLMNWDWYYVFIPLWIFMALFFCVPFTLVCLACTCRRRGWRDGSRFLSDPRQLWNFSVICWIVFLIPLLSGLVLASFNLESDVTSSRTPWRVIFAPIFVLEAILLAGTMCMDCIFYCT